MAAFNFAQDLKDFRARKGLTQKQAAKLFNVSLASFQNWEQSRRKPHALIERYIRRIISV